MVELKFASPEEARGWIGQNITTNDSRYTPWIEEISILSNFLYNGVIAIEEVNIPCIEKPLNEKLNKIHGPQKYHKYIALELLKLEEFEEKDVFIEFNTYGRRPDVYATKDSRTVLVECCSCYVNKIIGYLEEKNAELWIITDGYGPWEKNVQESERSLFFKLRRGPNWNEYYPKYQKYLNLQMKQIKNPFDV